jgi:para-aminobenzoate synthetase/4-amino-4-deoxychorismate lyase
VNTVFALLDDADASAEHPTSRLYTGYLHEHRCTDPATLAATCAAVQAGLAAGHHAVLLADYEWGAKLLGAGGAKLARDDASCLRVLMFSTLRLMSAEATAIWLAEQESAAVPAAAGVLNLRPEIDRAVYVDAIARIHEAIRDGETYQVNHTYRLHGQAWGAPLALYRRLRARQRVNFGALLRLPMQSGDRTEWVLSRSPELFVRHLAGRLQARPMKGTAARSGAPEGDSETARLLHADTKNRAENLMIVDLLRNDLGRIAQLGSVQVPELFRIEPYATVFQMTSSIEAQRRADVSLAGLLRALFPCGSITGAPKHHTMELIAGFETSPRGLYTGAIGWLQGSDDTACPDLCLAVAIRTLTLGTAGEHGLRPLELGVGGGIVADSVAADEFEETHWKARFVTALDPGVELFETMRATADEGIAHRELHRARIAASARALGFGFDAAAFDAVLDQALVGLTSRLGDGKALRLRLALRHDGELALTHARLDDLPADPVRLLIASTPLPAARPLAGHKSTQRAEYDEGIRAAQAVGAFDSLFFGSAGQLVEGGRCNVFLQQGDGRWFTPPLADGALPGVMRSVLLADPAWAASERRLMRADLDRAQAIVVCNALRGVVPAVLMRNP